MVDVSTTTNPKIAKALTKAAAAPKEWKTKKDGTRYERPWTRTPKPAHDFSTNEWIAWYDIILVNTSAGKDSQAQSDFIVDQAIDLGITDRLVAVHADLGRVEWDGTKELAERQAKAYGIERFEVVRNESHVDLLARIEKWGRWPGRNTRYCTSEFKTGQVQRLATRLVDELRKSGKVQGRPVRILNCLGLRAQESPVRAAKEPFRRFLTPQEGDNSGWSNGRRLVDEWLPIHTWSTEDVWATIKRSGVEYHPVYDQGMPRLSCSFCPLASFSANVKSATLRPELAAEYAALEVKMGHRYSDHFSMADVIEAANRAQADQVAVEDWEA